jgi:C-terminal processing protease CtpA/Prc
MYYTTDGYIRSAKKEGINKSFSTYYRKAYGKADYFDITYTYKGESYSKRLNAISRADILQRFTQRHSFEYDSIYYSRRSKIDKLYHFKMLSDSVAYLQLSSFAIGSGALDSLHQEYAKFLKEVFSLLSHDKIPSLIIDIRANTGGTHPNDSETWSYLVNKPLRDVQQAFVLSDKLAMTRYLAIPWYQRPFSNIIVKKEVKANMTQGEYGFWYYDQFEYIQPKKENYKGQLYLLVGGQTASAASMFAAMVVGNNENTIVVGEETGGGYYGHNGIFPVSYKLPHSNIEFYFSIVNIDQNVSNKSNQLPGRGIIPDYHIEQSLEDFLNNRDVTLDFTIKLAKENKF